MWQHLTALILCLKKKELNTVLMLYYYYSSNSNLYCLFSIISFYIFSSFYNSSFNIIDSFVLFFL